MALALLLAVSFAAHPAWLVLGKDASAELEVSAPAGARVTFSTTVGTITGVQRKGEVVRARFHAPPLRAPSVALVLAQIDEGGDRELRWVSIPLYGSDTMVIETRPGSKVVAEVAGSLQGPVSAEKDGTARLPMVVPPGVRQATLKITDRLGNENEKPLDLEPPPYSRVRLATRAGNVTPAAPVEVEIFVVKPDGSPDDQAQVSLASDEGEITLRGKAGPAGVYLAEYLPADGFRGDAQLEAKANGQLATLDVPVEDMPPGAHRFLWRSSLNSQRAWSISAGFLGGIGGSYDGATSGTVVGEMAMRVQSLPFELLLDLGGNFLSQVQQYGAVPALSEQAKAHALLAQIGVRATRQIFRRGLDAHLSLGLGLQSQTVHTTLPFFLGQTETTAMAGRFAAALGCSYRLGPGRALAQVQFDWAPSQVANLEGSTSGVQAMFGYLVTVR
ncbi:MAG TPA: hypothetical protein VLT85_11435 [Terriglobales bacterium]|nr:hypothetical protein [Terriglobales bacterium]